MILKNKTHPSKAEIKYGYSLASASWQRKDIFIKVLFIIPIVAAVMIYLCNNDASPNYTEILFWGIIAVSSLTIALLYKPIYLSYKYWLFKEFAETEFQFMQNKVIMIGKIGGNDLPVEIRLDTICAYIKKGHFYYLEKNLNDRNVYIMVDGQGMEDGVTEQDLISYFKERKIEEKKAPKDFYWIH